MVTMLTVYLMIRVRILPKSTFLLGYNLFEKNENKQKVAGDGTLNETEITLHRRFIGAEVRFVSVGIVDMSRIFDEI